MAGGRTMGDILNVDPLSFTELSNSDYPFRRRQGRHLSNKTTTIIIRRKSLRAALGRADPVLAETRPHAAWSPDAHAFRSRFAGTGCFKGAAFG